MTWLNATEKSSLSDKSPGIFPFWVNIVLIKTVGGLS